MAEIIHLRKVLQARRREQEQAMAIRPPDTTLLNTLGDCYQRTGEVEKAREILERSLQMDPDQEAIRQQLNDLPKSSGSP